MSGWVRYPPPHGALLLPLDARALAAEAVAREAACRPAALLARSAATRWIRRFGAGSLGARAAWSPGLAPGEWAALLDDVRQAVGGFDACAVWERRQGSRRGFALLLGGARGPAAFLKLRPLPAPGLETERAVLSAAARAPGGIFHLPALLGQGSRGGWAWLALSVLPALHRPAARRPLGGVLADLARRLRDLPRPPGTPPHWLPMHGDLTPWNLRTADGRLWLYDWERAGWGPPGADAVLFRATAAALRLAPPAAAHDAAARWPEAARYWASQVAARPAATRAERRLRRALTATLGVHAGRRASVPPAPPVPVPLFPVPSPAP